MFSILFSSVLNACFKYLHRYRSFPVFCLHMYRFPWIVGRYITDCCSIVSRQHRASGLQMSRWIGCTIQGKRYAIKKWEMTCLYVLLKNPLPPQKKMNILLNLCLIKLSFEEYLTGNRRFNQKKKKNDNHYKGRHFFRYFDTW